jgi:hypothetical protein
MCFLAGVLIMVYFLLLLPLFALLLVDHTHVCVPVYRILASEPGVPPHQLLLHVFLGSLG